MEIDNERAVVVTGASSGIGKATALALAERGDRLVLVARRAGELEEVARRARAAGAADVLVRPCDVTEAAAVAEVFADTQVAFGRVDAVVHAAAVAAFGEFVDVPPDVFDQVQRVNLLGSANVARSSLRLFNEQGHGHLVLFGSIVGKVTAPFMSPYVVSKWAVHGLARTLQAEIADPRIHVGLVQPGGVDTTIYDKAASYLGVQGKPPPPVMRPEQLADAVLGLLDKPRRERSVGLLNPLLALGFRLAPPVYDRIVRPLMSRLALDVRPVEPHPGNVFEPMPEPRNIERKDQQHAWSG